jgi:acetylornithine deacetylase/succinyl-diaminopimelate desuccinylase-like protein
MESTIKSLYAKWNWDILGNLAGWVVEEAIRIQQVPAPTFDEKARASYILSRFQDMKLTNISMDDVYNVYGRLPGKTSGAAILVLAHTDTVFPIETDLTVKREGNTIYGPGLGDNSMGVAGLLGLLKALQDADYQPACDIWFVANSCEEGLGDLKGAKAAFATLKDKINAVINIEGMALGHIYNAGIAVHRLHITATADGGHSWQHFGRPSAIHAIVELGAKITALDVPTTPRTTFNIGMIDGGHAINAIGTKSSIWLDMRSVSPSALDTLRKQIYALIEDMHSDDVRFDVEVVGDRPAGSIPDDHVLVKGAMTTLALVGMNGVLETGSTDGNVPLSQGCPTVTVGVTRGGNAHRLDEFIEVAPIKTGMKQLITFALATADHYAQQ